MTRRTLLAALAGAALDPERLLWRPGAKLISIPRPRQKAEIIQVGKIIDYPGGRVGIIGWWMRDGDYIGFDWRIPERPLVGGYTIDELRAIAARQVIA